MTINQNTEEQYKNVKQVKEKQHIRSTMVRQPDWLPISTFQGSRVNPQSQRKRLQSFSKDIA